MSPRRNRPKRSRAPRADEPEPLKIPSEIVSAPPGWQARVSTKQGPYICPGCNGRFDGTKPHVVAWPTDAIGGEKRHWHTSCWQRASVTGLR